MPFAFSAQKFILLAAVLLILSCHASAQKYRTAAGIRFNDGSYGLTVQQVFLPKATLEGLALVAPREWSATVLAERHFGILGPSLNYYFGAGAHLGRHKDDGPFYGFDAIIGTEYKIAFIPLVISFDFKPSLEYQSADWARFPSGFSLRYIIVKKRKTGLFKLLN